MKYLTVLLSLMMVHVVYGQISGCQKMSQCLDNANKQFEVCQTLSEKAQELITSRGTNNQNNPCKNEIRQMHSQIGDFRKVQSQERQACFQRRATTAQASTKTCPNSVISSVTEYQLPDVNGAQRNVRRQIRETVRECMKKSKEMTKQCKQMVDCCSESQLCHLEFELSQVHDDIRRVKLQMLEKKAQCGNSAESGLNRNQIIEGETY